MRLYTVTDYGEIYFKSLRKPTFREVRAPLREAADDDIVAFVGQAWGVEQLTGVALWRPAVGFDSPERVGAEYTFASYWDARGAMDEMLKRGWYRDHPTSVQAWKDYLALWGAWRLGHGRTVEQWNEIQRLWRETWGAMHADDRKYWAAMKWWEQVRAHPSWHALYQDALTRYKAKGWGDMSPKFAKDTADYYMRGFLKGEVSVEQFKKALHLWGLADVVGAALVKLVGWGMAILVKVFLPAVAIAGVLVVVINPSSEGIRRKGYRDSRLLMRYEERVWWADMVGRTAKGKGVYRRCEEVKATMWRRRVISKLGRWEVERLDMEPTDIGEEKISWFYWVSWPWYFNVRFRGYCTELVGGLYTLSDSWRWSEVTPTELYKDVAGNIRERVARWFDPREGEPSSKDPRAWCMELDQPEWVYYEGAAVD